MRMPTPQDIIKAMGTSLHEQHLKPRNFRKSGTTWIRVREWTQVINIQLSRWNSAEEAQFTVNLGISIPELHLASESLPVKGSLKERDCDLRCRIGQLFPSKNDHWWKVNSDTDIHELTNNVSARIEEFALPWFDRLGNFTAVAAELTDQKSPFMAALAFHFSGESTSAEEAMVLAQQGSNIHFLSKLKRIAAKQGIRIKT